MCKPTYNRIEVCNFQLKLKRKFHNIEEESALSVKALRRCQAWGVGRPMAR